MAKYQDGKRMSKKGRGGGGGEEVKKKRRLKFSLVGEVYKL